MRIVIYRSGRLGNEQWYWRAVAKNHKVIADGAEGYYKLGNAKRAANRFVDALVDGPEIVVLDA